VSAREDRWLQGELFNAFTGKPLGDPPARSWTWQESAFDPSLYYSDPGVSWGEARDFVRTHHYSEEFPAQRYVYGMRQREDDKLVGVVSFGTGTGKETKKWFGDLVPDYKDRSAVLQRLVLLGGEQGVGFNGESWFIMQAMRHGPHPLRQRGVQGVVTFSDPAYGHVGRVYQATNAIYTGKSKVRKTPIFAGKVLNDRNLTKIRSACGRSSALPDGGTDFCPMGCKGGKSVRSWKGAILKLIQLGARPPVIGGECLKLWLEEVLNPDEFKVDRGKHRYLWGVGRRDTRTMEREYPRLPYPRLANPGDGDCYEKALGLIAFLWSPLANEPSARLIHANVVGQGPIEGVVHGHAWVEVDRQIPVPPGVDPRFGLVRHAVDHSQGTEVELPADLYRRIGRVTNAVEYTRDQARHLAAKTKHYGPWHQANPGGSDERTRRAIRDGEATLERLFRGGALEGHRVVLTQPADRFPEGIIEAGARGVVVDADPGDDRHNTFIAVKLDNPPEWLFDIDNDWEGELHYYEVDEFLEGVELEGRANPPRRFDVRSPAQGLKVIKHPAITSNWKKALRWKPKSRKAVLIPCAGTKPFPDAPSHAQGYLAALEGKDVDVWVVSEPLGVVPYAWSRRYPQAHYDFPPKHLRGEAFELLAERIARWFEVVAPKYSKVTLALPEHHSRLVNRALELHPHKVSRAGIGECLKAGACPTGHYRATSHAYRGYLRRRANPGRDERIERLKRLAPFDHEARRALLRYQIAAGEFTSGEPHLEPVFVEHPIVCAAPMCQGDRFNRFYDQRSRGGHNLHCAVCAAQVKWVTSPYFHDDHNQRFSDREIAGWGVWSQDWQDWVIADGYASEREAQAAIHRMFLYAENAHELAAALQREERRLRAGAWDHSCTYCRRAEY
jgi:hypothetical protein